MGLLVRPLILSTAVVAILVLYPQVRTGEDVFPADRARDVGGASSGSVQDSGLFAPDYDLIRLDLHKQPYKRFDLDAKLSNASTFLS